MDRVVSCTVSILCVCVCVCGGGGGGGEGRVTVGEEGNRQIGRCVTKAAFICTILTITFYFHALLRCKIVLYFQFSLHHYIYCSLKGCENVLFELGVKGPSSSNWECVFV